MLEKAPTVEQSEAMVKHTTIKNHKIEVDLLTKMLDIYCVTSNQIRSFERTDSNDMQYVWLLLFTRTHQSMRSAMLLMLIGYYGPALALLRTVTEDWLVGTDCENNQPTLDALLNEKSFIGDRKSKLTYKDIAGRIQEQDKLVTDVVYNYDYKFQSSFVHASRRGLSIMKDPQTQTLTVVPSYNEVLFICCCELFMRNGLKMSVLMLKLIQSVKPDEVITWGSKIEPTTKEIIAWLETLKQKYGAQS